MGTYRDLGPIQEHGSPLARSPLWVDSVGGNRPSMYL
jgi:hypothetical protein